MINPPALSRLEYVVDSQSAKDKEKDKDKDSDSKEGKKEVERPPIPVTIV